MKRFKNKINQEGIALIIADFQHGEITECTCECIVCPLNKKLPVELVAKESNLTICNMLTEMSVLYEVNKND